VVFTPMSSAASIRFLGVTGAILFTLGTIGVVLAIYEKYREGRALDVFQNGYGQYETWAAYAGSLIAAALILGAACALRWGYLWRRSRLEGVSMKEIAAELKRGDP
jgi:hypothetical protein